MKHCRNDLLDIGRCGCLRGKIRSIKSRLGIRGMLKVVLLTNISYMNPLYMLGIICQKKGKHSGKKNLEAHIDNEFDDGGQRPVGKGKDVSLSDVKFEQARLWVLLNHDWYDYWRSKFELTVMFRSGRKSIHMVDEFIPLLRNQASASSDGILPYALGTFEATRYAKFECNGYSFSTKEYEKRKNVQNHGVSMKAENKDGVLTTYYGVILEKLDLHYLETTHTVFYCDWFDLDDRQAFSVDGISQLQFINFAKKIRKEDVCNEPFILASQASQVFYSPLPNNFHKLVKGDWHVVLYSPNRVTGAIEYRRI